MIAPASEPMIPLGRRASPSPENRLVMSPPMKEPAMPAISARPQSTAFAERPTTSCAAAPMSIPNKIMPRRSMPRAYGHHHQVVEGGTEPGRVPPRRGWSPYGLPHAVAGPSARVGCGPPSAIGRRIAKAAFSRLLLLGQGSFGNRAPSRLFNDDRPRPSPPSHGRTKTSRTTPPWPLSSRPTDSGHLTAAPPAPLAPGARARASPLRHCIGPRGEPPQPDDGATDSRGASCLGSFGAGRRSVLALPTIPSRSASRSRDRAGEPSDWR
jgi:hypothetical protein